MRKVVVYMLGKVLFFVNIHGNKWQMYCIFRENFL